MLMRSDAHHEGNKNECTSKTNRSLSLIGAASALGCPKPGCEQGPAQLQKLGLTDTLKLNGVAAHWHKIVIARPQHSATQAVTEHSRQIANCVAEQLSQNELFAVLGGDHSCAIGTWNGVFQARQGKPFGLIWVDAHMDSHTPHSSHSGALHGMPLACLLGFGPLSLTKLNNNQQGPALQPEHLCLVGVRSYEPEEAELLENLGVRIFSMAEIELRGMSTVMHEAIEIAKGAGEFGVSIDLDAIDPQIAPAVSIPEPGGLKLDDLNELLKPLAKTPGLIGIEVAEFNPLLDQQHQTARLISTILAACTPKLNSG